MDPTPAKSRFRSWAMLISIIFFCSILLAECFYLLSCVLAHYMDFSINIEKLSLLLNFIIILCLAAVIYLIYHVYFTKAHYVALSCSSKVSVEEYEVMKRTMTRNEVKKLTSSKEYQDYLRRKQNEDEWRGKEVVEDSESESEREWNFGIFGKKKWEYTTPQCNGGNFDYFKLIICISLFWVCPWI